MSKKKKSVTESVTETVTEGVREVTNPVDTFITRLICVCGTEMEYGDKNFPTQPPRFVYQCPKCQRKEISHVRYPHLTYKERGT